MAIKVRRGNFADFDKNKLVAGEFALVLDRGIPTGEVYFCVSPGNIRKLATIEELQALLNASGATYTALQQLIADLNNNPNQLTNILNNISALQSGKIDKTSIVQTTASNDTTKVPSSAVTNSLQNQINAQNDNLANKMNAPTSFPSSTDLNTIKTNTIAYCNNAVNRPVAINGFIEVRTFASIVTQEYRGYSDATVYYRHSLDSGTTWSAWLNK